MSALLERERELAELDAMVAEARAGRGRLVVIEAQAGLGKTRLLQAARTAGAGAGLRVLAARATELERDFPFALVRQLFGPQLAALGDAEREQLFEGASAAALGALGMGGQRTGDALTVLYGLYWLTAALADREPLLLAVDDAHWADAASLDYLAFLLPRLEELPLLLVIACRPGEADAERSLAQLATDAAAHRLAPGALSCDAATGLLAAELGAEPEAAFAATCHEVSGGNPFYLCELARTLAAHEIRPTAAQARTVRELAPERVTRTVLLRIARLSPHACAIARALAVLGDDSDHRLVAALAGLDAQAAREGADALRANAIFDPEPSLRFIHPLVRTAVYSDLPAGERGAAHERAADLLRERDASPEQLAVQLVAAPAQGRPATVETLLDAGRRALASGAAQSAIAYLMRALAEPPPAALRAPVLELLITASLREVDGSVFAAIEADVVAELERSPSLLSRWAAEVTPWMAINGRDDEARALLERAIEVADRADDVDRAVHLECQLSTIAQLPPALVRTRLMRYRDRVDADSAGERLVAALDAAWALFDGSAGEAAVLAERALRDARIFVEQAELLVPGEVLRALILTDRLDAAQRVMDQALALAQQRGAMWELLGGLYLRGHVALARGDLAAAEADVRQATEIARLRGVMSSALTLTALLVTILLERGELQAAEAELDATGTASGAVPAHAFFGALLLARGRLRLAQGRPQQAAEDLVELQRRRECAGTDASPFMQTGVYAALALAALGEHEQARELAEAALVHARRWGAPSVVSRALRALGLTRGGTVGLALLQEAATLLDGSPARLERAYALGELGAALRRANQRAQAREPLREALELARRCGATVLAKRAHDELLASGEKVRRYTPIGVESLTPSERRVAELAAAGMPNRQIAQTLFLTVKTIETHLGAAYDKLGIRSRRQLADALRD